MLLGWRPLLLYRLEAIASRLEAITISNSKEDCIVFFSPDSCCRADAGAGAVAGCRSAFWFCECCCRAGAGAGFGSESRFAGAAAVLACAGTGSAFRFAGAAAVLVLGRHHVMPGITCCHIVHDNVLRSNGHNVVRAALARPCRSYVCVEQSWRTQLLDVAHIGAGDIRPWQYPSNLYTRILGSSLCRCILEAYFVVS